MGRACVCCGGENCVNEFADLSVDRYKAVYFSLERTITEDVVGFSAMNSDGDVTIPNFLIKKNPAPSQYRIGSEKDAYNFSYFDFRNGSTADKKYFRRFGRFEDEEIVEITSELIEEYPELSTAGEITYNNRLIKTKTQKVSRQQRVIVQFSFDDIFDFSKSLWRMANLKIGNDDLNRTEIWDRFSLPNSTGGRNLRIRVPIQEAKINGPFYHSDSSIPRTFEQWDELFSTGVLNFDGEIERGKDGTSGLSPDRRYDNYIETTEEIDENKLSQSSSMFFMINPRNTGVLDLEGLDIELDSGDDDARPCFYATGQWKRFNNGFTPAYGLAEGDVVKTTISNAVFEFIRPAFDDDLGIDLRTLLTDYSAGVNARTSVYARTETPEFFWQDYWDRVDNMWTFVSKKEYLNYYTNVIKNCFRHMALDEYSNFSLDIKLFKPAESNKKSQIEKVFLEGSYRIRSVKEYFYVLRYNKQLVSYCSLEAFSLPPTEAALRSVGGLVKKVEVKEDVISADNNRASVFTYITNSSGYPTTFGFFNLDLPDSYFLDFTSGGKEYFGHEDILLYGDFRKRANVDKVPSLIVKNCYIQCHESINFKNYYKYRTLKLDGFEDNYLSIIGDNEASLLDVVKASGEDAPDTIEINPVVFNQQTEPHKIQISFKNEQNKFMPHRVTIEGDSPECSNGGCLATSKIPEWEIEHNISDEAGISLLPAGYIARTDFPCINFFQSGRQGYSYHFKRKGSAYSARYAKINRPDNTPLYVPRGTLLDDPPQYQFSPSPTSYGSWNFGEFAGWHNQCGTGFGGNQSNSLTGSSYIGQDDDPPKLIFDTHEINPFFSTATYGYRQNEPADKIYDIVKTSEWSKTIKILENIPIFVNALSMTDINDRQTRENHTSKGLVGFHSFNDVYPVGSNVLTFGNPFAKKTQTDAVLANRSRSGIYVENVIGAGIRVRLRTPYVYYYLENAATNVVAAEFGYEGVYTAWRNVFDAWDVICQEFEAEYTRQLNGQEVEYISSFLLEAYWYKTIGNYFFPDPDGKERQGDVAGYYMRDPYFKISNGQVMGPFKESGFQAPEKEYVVDVETNIRMPEYLTYVYSCGGGIDELMEHDDTVGFQGFFGEYDVDGNYFGVKTVYESINDVELFGWAIGNNASTYVGTHFRGTFGFNPVVIYGYTSNNGYWTQEPEIVSSTQNFDIPAGCPCTDNFCFYGPINPTFYSYNTKADGLSGDGSFTIDGFSVTVAAYGAEPVGENAAFNFTSDEPVGSASETKYINQIPIGFTFDFINLRHRKIVTASSLDSCAGLPALSFDRTDMADYNVYDDNYVRMKGLRQLGFRERVDCSSGLRSFKPGAYYNVTQASDLADVVCSSNGLTPDVENCSASWPNSAPAYDTNGSPPRGWMAGFDTGYYQENCAPGFVKPNATYYPDRGAIGFVSNNSYNIPCCDPDENWSASICSNGGSSASYRTVHMTLAPDTEEKIQEYLKNYESPTCIEADYPLQITFKKVLRNMYDDYTFTISQRKTQ